MRILVSGGGTAGHVSPVLATVDALRTLDSQLDVLYVGQRRGMEARLAREAGLPFASVLGGKIRRLPGAGVWRNLTQFGNALYNLRDLIFIALGTVQATWIVMRFKPDVIFNKVGPAGIPVGLAARLNGIPMVIHEPDLTPGWGNRTVSRWATSIAVGFPANLYKGAFPAAKLTYTGTPVQPAITSGERGSGRAHFGFAPRKPLLLIVGGSQGAHALNQAIVSILPELLEKTQVHHITGKTGYAAVLEATTAYQNRGGGNYRVEPYLAVADMGMAYAAADLVIARAGANTIAELATLGKPVILTPNQYAAAHQLKNAARLKDAGAALVVSDEEPQELLHAVRKLLASPLQRDRLSQAIYRFNTPDAAVRLAQLLITASGREVQA